jgi:pyruvate formate lyase activating enzyme
MFTQWKTAAKVLAHSDLVISDIKTMNDKVHRKHTGVSNKTILGNLKRVSEMRKDLILRIPLIPGINDDDENINATADFICRELGGRLIHMQILEFMHLGGEKCVSLGRTYPMEGQTIDREALHERALVIRDRFLSRDIKCIVGNE